MGARQTLAASGYVRRASKTITFDGATGTGEVGEVPIFTVTGEALILALVPFCTTLLDGATATLALGVTGSTALFIAATTATDIDADEFWVDTAPDPNGIAVPAALKDIAIAQDIIGTVATANITAGALRIDVYYIPLSSDGLVA